MTVTTCGFDKITGGKTITNIGIDAGNNLDLLVGEPRQLPLRVNGNSTSMRATWTSSDTSIITVDSTGLIVGVGRGVATIRATLRVPESADDRIASVDLYVDYRDIVVLPIDSITGLGATLTPIVRGIDFAGNPSGVVPATLSSSDNSTVLASGATITARRNGTATISATLQSISSNLPTTFTRSTTVKVRQVAKRVTFAATPLVFTSLNRDTTIAVQVVDTRDSLMTTPPTWSSLNTAVATVSSGGVMRALQAASTSIRATVDTVTATLPISVSQQPASITKTAGDNQTQAVGVAVSTNPGVTVRDAGNSPIAGTTVTFAVVAGGGSVTGATQTTNASGVATVGSWTLGTVAGPDTLSATAGSLSVRFGATGVAGAATQLAIVTQPSAAAQSGVTLGQQPALRLRDAFGNNVQQSGITVSAALTGGGTLGGTSSATTNSSGMAQFGNLAITGTIGNRTLTFSATSLTGATSSTIVLAAGAAAALSITTQPSATAISGAALGQQPAIQLRDNAGNAVAQGAVVVTATIASGGGSLAGSTTATTNSSGLATFATLAILGASGNRTLGFGATSLAGTTSSSIVVTDTSANQLAFVQQPTGATAGAVIAPAVTVAVQSASGATLTGDNSTVVTLSLASAPPGGNLGGTLSATVANGVATFSNLSDTVAGTYTLQASATGLTPDTSTSYTIVAGAASRIQILQMPPASTVAGTTWPSIQAAVTDAYGNTVPTATHTVTLEPRDSAGGIVTPIESCSQFHINIGSVCTFATLPVAGTLSVAASGGVATFTGLRPRSSRIGSVAFHGSGLTSAFSANSIRVSTSTASRLRVCAAMNFVGAYGTHSCVTANPVANSAFSPAVAVTDSLGNDMLAGTSAVTLAIGSNPTGAALTGATTVVASGGFANYSVSIDKGGTYTLTATATGLTSGTSASFSVASSGSASRVGFTVQPSNVVAGVAISPVVQVCVQDGVGNTVTTATNSITIAIGTNPGGATLGGTVSQNASSGCASFGNLTLNTAGSGYTLTAAATGLTQATSTSFDVTSNQPASWSQQSPSGGPPDGVGVAMLDQANNRLIVFGGSSISGSAHTNGVWVLTNADGTGGTPQWSVVTANGAAGAPPARHGHNAVYDATNNRLMVFGGCTGGCFPVANDVWVLTNANGLGGTPVWSQLSPTGSPPARQAAVAVYDQPGNRLIIYGGQDGSCCASGILQDAWVLTNANGFGGTPAWSQLNYTGGPAPGSSTASAVYDAASNRLIVFAGYVKNSGVTTNAVWALTNANGTGGTPAWINLVAEGAAGSPSARAASASGYDATNNRLTIFGGSATTEVWVLSNANGVGGIPAWAQVSPTGGPPAAIASGVLRVSSARFITVGSTTSHSAHWVLTRANGL